MFDDRRGVAFTASGANAVTAFDETVDAYLSSSPDTGTKLKNTFATASDMVMPAVALARFWLANGRLYFGQRQGGLTSRYL